MNGLQRHVNEGTCYIHEGDLELSGGDIHRLPSLKVSGNLDLHNLPNLVSMGEFIEVGGSLFIDQAPVLEHLPSKVTANVLTLKNLSACKSIGVDVTARCVHIENLGSLECIPKVIRRARSITIKHCSSLLSLFDIPNGWSADDVHIENCESLLTLPKEFVCRWSLLVISCENFQSISDNCYVGGTLNLTNCRSLKRLGSCLWVGGDLILKDTGLTELPTDLYCEQAIHIEGSKIKRSDKALRDHKVRWKGIDVGTLTSYQSERDWAIQILAKEEKSERWSALKRFGTEKIMKACGIRFSDAVEDPFIAIERLERGEPIFDIYMVSLGRGHKAYSLDTRMLKGLPNWNEAAYLHAWSGIVEGPDRHRN